MSEPAKVTNRVKQMWRDKRPTFGAIATIPSIQTVQIMAQSLDWIIVGGESGRNARPMNPAWARSLRDQASRLERTFNFKQMGARTADKGC